MLNLIIFLQSNSISFRFTSYQYLIYTSLLPVSNPRLAREIFLSLWALNVFINFSLTQYAIGEPGILEKFSVLVCANLFIFTGNSKGKPSLSISFIVMWLYVPLNFLILQFLILVTAVPNAIPITIFSMCIRFEITLVFTITSRIFSKLERNIHDCIVTMQL